MKIFNFEAKYRDIRAGYHGGEAKYRDIRGGYHGGEAKYRDMRAGYHGGEAKYSDMRRAMSDERLAINEDVFLLLTTDDTDYTVFKAIA